MSLRSRSEWNFSRELTISFLNESSDRATQLLKTHEDELHTLAKALVEYETLSLDEVRTVLQGKKLEREAELAPGKEALA